MNSINSKWTYSLAGSASVAVLAVMLVGPNITDLLPGEQIAERNEPAKTSLADKSARQSETRIVGKQEAVLAPVEERAAAKPVPEVNDSAAEIAEEVAELDEQSQTVTLDIAAPGEPANDKGLVILREEPVKEKSDKKRTDWDSIRAESRLQGNSLYGEGLDPETRDRDQSRLSIAAHNTAASEAAAAMASSRWPRLSTRPFSTASTALHTRPWPSASASSRVMSRPSATICRKLS